MVKSYKQLELIFTIMKNLLSNFIKLLMPSKKIKEYQYNEMILFDKNRDLEIKLEVEIKQNKEMKNFKGSNNCSELLIK